MRGENVKPSQEVINEINKGANWLSNWITERYNLGYLSKDEYEGAIDRLKNTKVYVTGKGYDKMVEALEKGELHIDDDTVLKASRLYDENHQEDNDIKLSKEEKAIAHLKEVLAAKPTSNLLGFCMEKIKEPVIFLDVDLQRELYGNNNKCSSLSSLAVHELTHNLRLVYQEDTIDTISKFGTAFLEITDESNDSIVKKRLPDRNAVAPEINVSVIADDSEAIVKSAEKNNKKEERGYPFSVIKEGVEPNSYLDDSREIYARFMQLRYEYGLKPDENFTSEMITDIERKAKEAQQDTEAGEKQGTSYIDLQIVERYKAEFVGYIGNETASVTGVKEALKVQRTLFERRIERLEAMLGTEAVAEVNPKDNSNKSRVSMLISMHNEDRA